MTIDTRMILEKAILSNGIELAVAGGDMVPERESGQGWSPAHFFKAFSQVPRRVAAKPLHLDAELNDTLCRIYPGFAAQYWDFHMLIRAWLMNTIPVKENKALLSKLFQHAEMRELIALYRGLYTLPNREDFTLQVAEGVRTNMVSVFDAIALRNPITPEALDDVGWAQVVLKAIFMDRPLFEILNLDERRTLDLALTASDYVHERWAAGRSVCPELWRLMVGFRHKRLYADLLRAAQWPDALTAQAARLALQQSAETDAEAERLYRELPELPQSHTSWEAIGTDYDQSKASRDALHVLYPAARNA